MALAAVATGAAWRPASASETDQYLAWGVELTDSAGPLNRFLNEEFEHALARLSRKGKEHPCPEVANRLYNHVFASLVSSRLRRFIQDNPDLELFPGPEVSYWRYREQSVLRRKAFPVFLPMARTIRIGEVYLGIDKLAHFFGIGRRYHLRYQRHRRHGRSPEEAERRTILWGLAVERTFVGGLVDGIVSHADLEANYQGLRLAREMCEGEDPYLARSGDGWRLARPIDLTVYVNPGFDESYNNNVFTYRWRLVKPILRAEYCPRLEQEEVRQRLSRYREIDPGSFSRQVIAEDYRGRRRSQKDHALETVCAAGRSPAADLPPTARDASTRPPGKNGPGSGGEGPPELPRRPQGPTTRDPPAAAPDPKW